MLSHIWEFSPSGNYDLGLRAGFGPQGGDLGLMAGIWASRLGVGPKGWDFGLQAGIWASWLEFGQQG